jgi:predicted amidohydrolase
MLADANTRPGGLIVLPEMFATGFSLNTNITADRDNTTLTYIQNLADRTQCTVHGGRTLLEPDQPLALNVATICRPDAFPSKSPTAEYAKIHPFTFGREGEKFRGGVAVTTYQAAGLTICPAVCYDLRFPELFRRGLALGATAFALGANWPAARQTHWRTLLTARAIENQAYVLGVNRCGNDPHLEYAGGTIAQSFAINVKNVALGSGVVIRTVWSSIASTRSAAANESA